MEAEADDWGNHDTAQPGPAFEVASPMVEARTWICFCHRISQEFDKSDTVASPNWLTPDYIPAVKQLAFFS